MGLQEIIWNDAKKILADQYGPGQSVIITSPDGGHDEINGFYTDISQSIDPDTGQMFSGRFVTVTFSLIDIDAALIGIPRGISDPGAKPWLVTISDVLGNEYTFKVSASHPDRSMGTVICDLEVYDG
jgi:hypothetical protein